MVLSLPVVHLCGAGDGEGGCQEVLGGLAVRGELLAVAAQGEVSGAGKGLDGGGHGLEQGPVHRGGAGQLYGEGIPLLVGGDVGGPSGAPPRYTIWRTRPSQS